MKSGFTRISLDSVGERGLHMRILWAYTFSPVVLNPEATICLISIYVNNGNGVN